ncbi:hypothetical protein ASG51_20165 [Methylobacterium sp. Leaf465]|nr:hypothetical protein ASG51_20165 [Methylobacterium sp. Leaf465]
MPGVPFGGQRILSCLSIETQFLPRNDQPGLRDLDRVVLIGAVNAESGARIEAGTEGTIVAVQPGGRGYPVAFAEPAEALAAVPAALPTLAVPAER